MKQSLFNILLDECHCAGDSVTDIDRVNLVSHLTIPELIQLAVLTTIISLGILLSS